MRREDQGRRHFVPCNGIFCPSSWYIFHTRPGRQAGKSTLVRNCRALRNHLYLTLDSVEIRAQALEAPAGLAGRSPLLILDEVQRAPDLLLAIKAALDAVPRRPGRFVLTGSANLLAVKQIKETLAGRASYVTLWPLTRRERLGLGTSGYWSELVNAAVPDWPEVLAAQTIPQDEWRVLVRRSGYPPVGAAGLDSTPQADWLQGYLDAYVERDVAELSQISRPLVLTDLLAWAWSQSPRPTVMHWRTTSQLEVDFVVALPSGRLLPIEIKAAAKPGWGDVPGLRAFLEEYEDLAPGGLVLHGGRATYRLSPKLVAAPWWKVL